VFYYNRGDEIKALDHYLRSLKIAENVGYKRGTVSALNNIGGVYYYKSATQDKALNYYLMALPLCKELGDDKQTRNILGTIAVNVGNIYLRKKNETDSADQKLRQNYEAKAFEYFNTSLQAYKENPASMPYAYHALGGLYLDKANFKEAAYNFEQALKFATQTDGKLHMVRALIGLAKVDLAKNNKAGAIAGYRRAEKLANELDATLELEDLYNELSHAYQQQGDYRNALKYRTLLSQIKDTLYNADTDKRIANLQFDFDLQKKQNEINLLTKDKSIKELQLKKQETFKNALAIVLGLIVVVVFVLYRSYRIKAKTNVMLDRKNMEIERLLLNILPAEVAHELQTTGKATPRNYDQVSVMFTDFKGFTTLADKMTPQELVTELGACFMAFDAIIDKYGLEKIKTIGDSYMCAGGIPTPGEGHIFNIVKASLEIQDWVYQNNQKRKETSLPPWDVRIGIHIGPVVAGVVGNKKYAYDIWGSTVNIASRMESSGMPGHVNVSATTYELIKERFACVYRGKISAKNIGEIDMYLVDHEIENPSGFRTLEEVQKKTDIPQPIATNLLQ
jgi:class 3 adenylate cyclase